MKRRWWVFRGQTAGLCVLDLDKIMLFFEAPGGTQMILALEGVPTLFQVHSTLPDLIGILETAENVTLSEAKERHAATLSVRQIAVATAGEVRLKDAIH